VADVVVVVVDVVVVIIVDIATEGVVVVEVVVAGTVVSSDMSGHVITPGTTGQDPEKYLLLKHVVVPRTRQSCSDGHTAHASIISGVVVVVVVVVIVVVVAPASPF